MGFLTTFTIYNDSIDLIKKYPNKFAEIIYDASSHMQNKSFQYGLGYFSNLINAQITRHADDHTIYIHMGNCVTEMNAYSKETKESCKNNRYFFNQKLEFLEDEIKALKRLREKVDKEG